MTDLPADRRLWCTSVHPDDPTVHGGGWHERSECPVCSRKSSHPEDIRTGWCAACSDFTGPGYDGLAAVNGGVRVDPWAGHLLPPDELAPAPAAAVELVDQAVVVEPPRKRWPWRR